MKRIGIDYTAAVHQGAGIGRLTRNIIQALARLPEASDPETQYTLLIQGRTAEYGASQTGGAQNVISSIDHANWRQVRTRISEQWWYRLWYKLRLPIPVEWLTGPLDLYHSPDFVLPPTGRKTRTIVTIHDLSFVHFPACFRPSLLAYLQSNVPQAIKRADCILADSENTRQDLISIFDVAPEQVRTILSGVEARFTPIQDRQVLDRVRAKYGLPPRFILGVGTIQPRKNYVRLIEAFAQLDDPDISLVLAGGKGWLYDEVLEKATDKRLDGRVILTGFVDDVDLPVIYNLAEVLAMPSLYEGFGLPPLEAMACGVPVIVADNSSLPEVVGEAGLLFETTDTDALSEALQRALNDTALRETMIRRGRKQASRFTWHNAAQKLLNTYQSLVD